MLAELPLDAVTSQPWAGHPYLAALGCTLILGSLGTIGWFVLWSRFTDMMHQMELRVQRLEQHTGLEHNS